jgi:predicted nuclease of predicted toxin-antitoxin system
MKLLFDQNLSPRLVTLLHSLFPGSEHVSTAGLDKASDAEVWQYAQANGLVIVSKDSDFSDLAVIRGFPPKVIWLQIGNCTTMQIETLIRNHVEAIEELGNDENTGVLSLS